MNKLLVVCGPTATGKTKLALDFGHQFNGELVSADSRQVYKDLDALTGKDRPPQGERIWMYDVIDRDDDFSVSQYERLARRAIDNIRDRGKLPIIVGGTGLYIQALTQPLSLIHVPPNQAVRQQFAHAPREVLQKELQMVDVHKWSQMNVSDRNNPRRLIRAIEIAKAKKSASHGNKVLDTLWIGLTAPMDILEKRIKKRIEDRWIHALKEVQELMNQRISTSTILGFSHIVQFLNGTLSQNESMEQWVRGERQYAKRQLTWFKRQPGIHWYDITRSGYKEEISEFVHQWYTKKR